MDHLPPELVSLVLGWAAGYAPALREVCRAWRRLIAIRQPDPASISDLARRGETDLLVWIREECAARGIDLPPEFARRVMSIAAQNGHLQLMALAEAWGGRDYADAAMSAARGGHPSLVRQVMEWLKRRPSDLVPNKRGLLCAGARLGDKKILQDAVEIVKGLADGVGPHDAGDMLIWSARAGHSSLVCSVLALDPDSGSIEIAVRRAALRGHTDIVTLLCQEGKVVSCVNEALKGAVEGGSVALAKLAIQWGARLTADDLSLATLSGSEEMVSFVHQTLDAGALITFTALHELLEWATVRGHDRLVRLAVRWGATPKSTFSSLIRVAAANGYEPIVRLLWSMGDTGNAALAADAAADRNHESIVRLFLSWGYFEPEKVLAHASRNENESLMRLAVERGATGLTSAMLDAAAKGRATATSVLIDLGADASALLAKNGTPPAVVRMLRRRGLLPIE